MIASPCTGVCKWDPATGWCAGCGRTQDEIVRWGSATEAQREQIWAQLPERAARLRIDFRRPAWTDEALRDEALARLDGAGGTWFVGVPGASVELRFETADIVHRREEIVARAPGVAFRLRLDRHARALIPVEEPANEALIAAGGPPSASPTDPARDRRLGPVAWAVLRARRPDVAVGLVERGPDPGPIDPEARGTLFDVGLGSSVVRYMLRTEDEDLVRRLRTWLGVSPRRVLDAFADELATVPTHVVETAHARVEVEPPPHGLGGEATPGGVGRTCLRPGLRVAAGELPPGWALPSSLAPVALWAPSKDAAVFAVEPASR